MECVNFNCESFISTSPDNCDCKLDVTKCPDYVPPSGMTNFDYMTKEARVKEWEKYHEGLTGKGWITPEERERTKMECVNYNCESYRNDEENNCIDCDDVTECPDFIMSPIDYQKMSFEILKKKKEQCECVKPPRMTQEDWIKGHETPEDRVMEYDKSVKHPSHYTAYPLEVIDIIKLILDEIDRRGIKLTSFEAACLKDEIKYRFRAGLKGDAAEDIAKAMQYKQFRETK